MEKLGVFELIEQIINPRDGLLVISFSLFLSFSRLCNQYRVTTYHPSYEPAQSSSHRVKSLVECLLAY